MQNRGARCAQRLTAFSGEDKYKELICLQTFTKNTLYLDGGSGTSFQACGLKPGELPEVWNITNPNAVINLHRRYLEAGSDIITANTFGANILKFSGDNDLPALSDIIGAAFANAKEAMQGFDGRKIALDIGPTGRMLKPLGDLDFEDAVEVFAETVRLGVENGADIILIETMNDCYETKAAVLAAKENSDLPVFVTNTYDESGKLMTGASPAAMVAMLEGLRVDALGINCGLGPDKMVGVVDELLKYATVPVIVQPNAGLPIFRDGRTEYDVTPDDFAKAMADISSMGATILGGCCGTTPEHIRVMINKTANIEHNSTAPKLHTIISSYTNAVEFGKKPILIGERINPTGKSAFKAALREGSYDYILNEGVAQQELGADVLDVNVGLPEIDEAAVLTQSVTLLQSVTDLPLQIDTSDAKAMESALRRYNGKPLINSVNGKEEVMNDVFPLAAKYGGVIIALTLDESGIPNNAHDRVEIAKKIIARAADYGIASKDIIVDCLAMTVSSDSSSALVTLECLCELTKLGIKTSLGVSNVSFGLPARSIINSTFFAMALTSGLSAAIMNPHSKEMMSVYYSFCALTDKDPQCGEYIAYASADTEAKSTKTTDKTEFAPDEALRRAILKGLKDDAALFTEKLSDKDPLAIVNECIIPSLNIIGADFENKKAFLPQLLMSAEAAKAAFEVIKARIASSGEVREKKYKIIIATVKGDIHDIGKNIVKVLLENYDYDVTDLGKDVPPEVVADAAAESGAPLVGLSALMTTTVPAMEETIKLLRERAPQCKVVVGGAVLTQEYADMIGADKYAADAMETVRYAESLN